MNAPLKAVENAGTLEATMGEIGRRAREAAHALALAPGVAQEPRAGRHGQGHPRLARGYSGRQR